MIPWKNTWLQLAAFAAVMSGVVLILDWRGAGSSNNNTNGNSGTSTSSYTPPPAPANLAPQDTNAFTNSLGMKLVPAGTHGVLFSIWDTRVEDYQQFVNETQYNAGGNMQVLGKNGFVADANASWSNPGFSQTLDSPVVGVSWNDANAFCLWLTNKERQAGLISDKQTYRLPTDAEWTAAAGNTTYPWGNDFPPGPGVGNYYRQGDGYQSPLTGTDGYACSSPVGTYPANSFGLYDMGGNVFQMCEDFYRANLNSQETLTSFTAMANDGGGQAYRVLRGASWYHQNQLALYTSFHGMTSPDEREQYMGFRVVLTKPTSWGAIIALIVVGLMVLAGAWWFYKGRFKSSSAVQPST